MSSDNREALVGKQAGLAQGQAGSGWNGRFPEEKDLPLQLGGRPAQSLGDGGRQPRIIQIAGGAIAVVPVVSTAGGLAQLGLRLSEKIAAPLPELVVLELAPVNDRQMGRDYISRF